SELIKSNSILKAITSAQSQFIANTLPQVLFNDLLENLLILTDSEYGFIGEISYNQQKEYCLKETYMKLRGKPSIKIHSLTNIFWNKETKQFYNENAPHNMKFHNLKTLLEAVITTGKPVISNHSSKDHRQESLLESHPSLDAFLGLPFYHNNKLIGMVGVANRPQGYDDNLVEYLQPFLTTCANLIKAYRNNRSRQQAEREKEASENKLQALLTYSSDIVSIFDKEGKLIYNSPTAEKIYGFSLEEMQQMRTFDLIHPDDRARVGNSFSQLLDHPQEIITVQYRYQTKSNEYIWIETVASNQLHNPNIKGIVANSRNISERKQAEKALRESEQKFRQIAENIREVFWIIDISKTDPSYQNLTYASPTCKKIWGYSPDYMYENPTKWIESIHPDDRDRIKRDFWQKLLEGEFDYQYRIIRSDGTQRWIRDRGFTIQNQSGDLVRVAGLAQDITEQKKREQEIKRLNEQLEERVSQRTAELEMLLNTLPDFVFVVEPETMKLLFCNQVFAKGIGFDHHKQVQGKTIFDCFNPEIADYFAQQNQQVFDSGETLHLEEIITLPDGDHYFDTYKVPLKNSHGEVYALLATSRDVTELVKTKQVLIEQTTQLEATNQELDSFCYSVSHDLRAPLRHIHGFVNALKPRLFNSDVKDDPKVIHYLDVIEKSSQKMGRLIDGLLTLSRVGRRELVFHEVNLNAVVKTAIDLVCSEGINIEFKIGQLPTVLGDSALLQQVFINLIQNSVKFSQGQNPIQIEVDCLEDGTLFVADNGVGFDMKYAEQLFGAFQRLHSQKEFEGTGIGLSIVQRIIHRHGGRIWARSGVGEGATFYFKLN
ncbi:PAS domain S-box protein, partial [Crocosphaera chwakensis]